MPILTSNTQISSPASPLAESDRRGQWSDVRVAAVVEAAYILQAVRR